MLSAPGWQELASGTTLHGQTWRQFSELLLAFGLSSAIGVERQLRQKSAGLRTHTLVGVGAALFLLVSKYGFTDILGADNVSFDPSRVAAQIVSGIGFIGGGLIFVRQDAVRGLTTAAGMWVTCAVGMACGAGLPLLAVGVTGLHFVVAYAYPPLIRLLSGPAEGAAEVRITYLAAHGVLPAALVECVRAGFQVSDVSVRHHEPGESADEREAGRGRGGREDAAVRRVTSVVLQLEGSGDSGALVSRLSDLDGVLSAGGGRMHEPTE